METVTTTFDPLQHGFKFVNYFDLKEFTKISLPFISFAHISLGDMVYGLCGGCATPPWTITTSPSLYRMSPTSMKFRSSCSCTCGTANW
jgi:hypothetical protein